MKIRLRSVSSPPSRIKSPLPRALRAKEIHSPLRLRIKASRQRLHRNRQFRHPDMMLRIQPHRTLQPASQVTSSLRKNIQVNPHPVRTHLKLPIIPWPRRVRLEKNFRHITIPELIATPICLRILEQNQLPIPALKAQVESLRRPQPPRARFPLRVDVLALPILRKRNRLRRLPLSYRMPRIERDFMRDPRRGDRVSSRMRVRFFLAHNDLCIEANRRYYQILHTKFGPNHDSYCDSYQDMPFRHAAIAEDVTHP